MQTLCSLCKAGDWKIWFKRGICGILALVLVWAIAERILWENIEETIIDLVHPEGKITISYKEEKWTVERLSADIVCRSALGARYFVVDNIVSERSLPEEEPLRFRAEGISFDVYPAGERDLYLNVEYHDFFRRTYFLNDGFGNFKKIYQAIETLLEELENEKLNG